MRNFDDQQMRAQPSQWPRERQAGCDNFRKSKIQPNLATQPAGARFDFY